MEMLVVILLLSMVAGCGAPVPPAASLPDQPTAATAPTTPSATAAPASGSVKIRVFAPQDTTLYASYDLATNSFT
jgi:hypothetical protein